MIKFVLSFLFAASLFSLPRVPVTQVATYNNMFALDLYKQVIKNKGNTVFSSYAVSSAFAIPYLGAKGETESRMREFFRYPLSPTYLGESFKRLNEDLASDPQVKLAISAWFQKGMSNEFKELASKYFEGIVDEGDFAIQTDTSRFNINKWVSEKTDKKVPRLLSVSDLSRATKILLVSEIYFSAPWLFQFERKKTESDKFFISQTSVRNATFVHNQGSYPFYENETVTVVELPFFKTPESTPRLSFVAVVPKEVEGLKPIESALTIQNYNEWINGLKLQTVKVAIPKFRMNEIHNFKDVIERMGLPEIFDDESDFSGISESDKYHITKVIQKIAFQLDEKGINTKRQLSVRLSEDEPQVEEVKECRADRPFIFFVIDNAFRQILFMGRIVQP